MKDITKQLRECWYSDDYGYTKDDLCNARNAEAKTAAQEIEKLREIILRQDNEMSNLRQRNSDLRERNTRLLSQIQEMEAREQ